jgi:hypothetical protein
MNSRFQASNSTEIQRKSHLELMRAVQMTIVHLTRNFNVVSLNLISSDNQNTLISDFKTELLSRSSSIEVSYFVETTSLEVDERKRFSNVLVIESFVDFMKVHRRLATPWYQKNGFYLIVLVYGKIPEVQKMFELLWQLQIYNVNVMFEEENGEVLLKTFMPFSPGKCGNTTPVLINKFKNGKFRNSDELFPRKFKNLHQCEVRVSIANNTEPETIVKFRADGSQDIFGQDINFINVLSQRNNFRINFTFVGRLGFLLSNGSAAGPLKALIDGSADISVSGWILKLNRIKFLDYSTSYVNDQIIFVIPGGRELTAVERLVYPFHLLLWISIFGILVFAVLIICLIRRRLRSAQDFMFGQNVGNPFVNLMIGFIGGSQTNLPRTNFARFLLMMFLIYSLIIRTLYQAAFYELLNSKKLYGEVKSIDELLESDFKIFAYFGSIDLFHGTEAMKNRFEQSNTLNHYFIQIFQSHSC